MRLVVASVVVACLAAAGCAPAEAPPTPEEAPAADRGHSVSVVVERLEIALGQSFPVQVRLLVEGHVTGACDLDEPRIALTNRTFVVELDAADVARSCEGPERFRRSILLPTHGLEAGRYDVRVHGRSASFDLHE